MRVRSMFSRLRSGHATELKAYRKRIGLDVSELCIHCDMDAAEDNHHTLSVCPQLEEMRRRLHPENFVDSMLTTYPEVWRNLIVKRFEKLNEGMKEVEDEGGGSPSDCTGPQA